MPIVQTQCTSFKVELFQAIHDFVNDIFKVALYSSSATLNADTTAYSSSGEISGTGYSAGGIAVSGITISSADNIAYIDFDDPSWTNASFTARGALLYNSSKANRAVGVLDFGADKTAVTTRPFTLVLPAATSSTAIIRI